jgi:hypothetical protein
MRFPSLRLLLRAASIVSLGYCLGHMSGLPWTPGETDPAVMVVEHMRSVQFEAEGATRTYWDFYFGFGIMVGVFLATQALSLWFIERLAVHAAARVVPLLATLLLGELANVYLSFRYFFALPAVFGIVIALLIAVAIYRARGSAQLVTRG